MPDNLKSAVFKVCKYEPALNENFNAFAVHYGIAVIPERSRHPKDKAHVENIVKITYQSIYANLPEKYTITLSELNQAIMSSLEKQNNRILTGRDYSRSDPMHLELPSLHPLPESYYEMRKIKQVTVMKKGHVPK